jgi:hypothetical protein
VDGTIDPTRDYVRELADSLGRDWSTVTAAKESANDVRRRLSEELTKQLGAFSSEDVDVVAFGSVARQECISGSDVDWTLLIDGQCIPDHRDTARRIRQTIASGFLQPGAEGVFGNMAFSHDIVHNIGGQADTNRNTTQRVLLLLESFPIRHRGHQGSVGTYERVTKNILFRYLHDDTNFYSAGGEKSRIPRFLLNDVVRYWRTMCVDFAYKEWEQAGVKWAIRNIKLRMSRKLLFVSSLLTVFSCHQNSDLEIKEGELDQFIPMMQEHLFQFVQSTPMNIVVWTLMRLGMAEHAGRLLDHYDQYLARLNDSRAHLENLTPNRVYEDPEFLVLREISHEFQRVLTEVFFDAETELREFTVTYGVF